MHSAAGGIGTLAVELVKVFGASTVIETAGTAAKRRIARELGGDAVVDFRSERWPQEVLAATGGRGVDVVLDAVGGDVGEQSFACLAPFGRLVTYGVSSQRLAFFAGSQLTHGNDSVVGYRLTSRLPLDDDEGPVARGVVGARLSLAAAGRLRVVVSEVLPLQRATDAHRALSDRRTVGKVVLTT